jgi:4a-hydroxytetrahydrobiopterin dehydratase
MAAPLLDPAALDRALAALPGWTLAPGAPGPRLCRAFAFPDFAAALAFTNRIGALAEAAGHHPDLRLGWGRVEVELWTHDAGGVTALDLELAAAIGAP